MRRAAQFAAAIIVTALVAMTLFGTLTVLPLYLQDQLGIDPLATGLLLLPGGLLLAALSPVVGRLYDRVGPAPLVVPGAVLLALSQVTLAITLSQQGSPAAGHGHVHCDAHRPGLPLHPVDDLGAQPAACCFVLSRQRDLLHRQQLAGAAGTAALVTLMTIGSTGAGPESGIATGAQDAYIGASVITVLAVVGAVGPTLIARRQVLRRTLNEPHR